MRIVILTTACSSKVYSDIVLRRKKGLIDSGQKFFNSVAESLAVNGADVTCVVSRPVSFSTFPRRFLPSISDCENGVKYEYLSVLNLPLVRSLWVGRQYKKRLKKILNNHSYEKTYVVCDTLIYEASRTIRLKKNNSVFIATVTDLPYLVHNMFKSNGIKGLIEKNYYNRADKCLKKYDGYVLLTPFMNPVCNPENKPYIIMEGITKTIDFPQRERIADKPVVLYAGKLLRDCGVLELAKSAEFLGNYCEIWLYGSDCDCMDELLSLRNRYSNLLIHEAIPYNDLYKIEVSADILINPRPVDKEFIKYSFPSKTIEYLQTGVPVLMFKLPGIPGEYDDYLYYLNNCQAESLAKSIISVLSLPSESKAKKSIMARDFIVRKKGIASQGKRLIDFLATINLEKE